MLAGEGALLNSLGGHADMTSEVIVTITGRR
jgi:hypothetical protein